MGFVTQISSDTDDAEIRLRPSTEQEPGRLAGLVRDGATGGLVTRLVVGLRLSDGTYQEQRSADARGVGTPAGFGQSSPFLKPGRFDFQRLRPGAHRVYVIAEGFAPQSLDVVVKAGETAELPPIELTRGIVV